MTLFTLPTSKNWSPAGQSLLMDFSTIIVSYTSPIPMTSSSKFSTTSMSIYSPDILVRIRQWTLSAAIIPGLDSMNLSRNIVNLVQLVCKPNPRGINLMVYWSNFRSLNVWNSISMDFIETLLTSSGCDSILVIVDQLSKQGIFILTTIHCTSEDLQCCLLCMCSTSMAFQNMSPPTSAPNLSPAFSTPSEKHLTWSFTSLPVIIQKVTDKLNRQIKPWSSTYGFSATISKTIGIHCFHLWNSPITTLQVLLPEYLCSSLTKVIVMTSNYYRIINSKSQRIVYSEVWWAFKEC